MEYDDFLFEDDIAVDDTLLMPEPRKQATPEKSSATPEKCAYVVNEATGWSSEEEPSSPILTDNVCNTCYSKQDARWSCKQCDMKYCESCWAKHHPPGDASLQHEKRTFRYRSAGATGKLVLSNNTPLDAINEAFRIPHTTDDTPDTLLQNFLKCAHP